MMGTTITKSRFEKSADTLILENLLRETDVDGVVTYDTMSEKLGRDVRVHCHSNLRSALKICERDGVCFDCVQKVGYKRLSATGVVDSTVAFISRTRRTSTRALNRLASVEFDSLPPERQSQHLAYSAQLGAVHLFSTSKATKKIEGAVTNGQMAIGSTLKLFTE